jgi:hypothetical protein
MSERRPSRARHWPWVVLVLLALNLMFALAIAAVAWESGDALAAEGMRVFIDGRQIHLPSLEGRHFLMLVGALFVLGIVLLVVVPAAVLLALLAALLAIVLALLLSVAAAVAFTSPLWLPLLLLWLMVRPKPGAPRPPRPEREAAPA